MTPLENAELYAKYILDFVSDYKPDDLAWNVESKFPLWYEPESGGTADFWAVDKVRKTLYIRDYKSGRIPVQSYKNPQLAIYAIAAYDELTKFFEIEHFDVGAVQPLIRHGCEPWEFDLEEAEHIREQVDRAVREINNPLFTPRFEPGDKQCQWCRHRSNCVARANMLEEDIPPVLKVEELSDEKALDIWTRAALHKSFLAALEERIREMDPDTRGNGGFKLVRGSRRVSWVDEKKVVEALAESGVDLYNPPTLKSPAALREELGEVIEALSLTKTTYNKPSLVPVDDRREALEE